MSAVKIAKISSNQIEKSLGYDEEIKKVSSAPNLLADDLFAINCVQPTNGRLNIGVKRRHDMTDNFNKTASLIGISLSKFDELALKVKDLETKNIHLESEIQRKDNLIKYADYVSQFNQLFFVASNIISEKEKRNFLDDLADERNYMLIENQLDFFDFNDENHQKTLSSKPFHRRIIDFYQKYGVNMSDYFKLNNLKLERNIVSHPLPKSRTDLIQNVKTDINRLKANQDSTKSMVEHLLNGFLKFYNVKI